VTTWNGLTARIVPQLALLCKLLHFHVLRTFECSTGLYGKILEQSAFSGGQFPKSAAPNLYFTDQLPGIQNPKHPVRPVIPYGVFGLADGHTGCQIPLPVAHPDKGRLEQLLDLYCQAAVSAALIPGS
jgi:hypothetical protein